LFSRFSASANKIRDFSSTFSITPELLKLRSFCAAAAASAGFVGDYLHTKKT